MLIQLKIEVKTDGETFEDFFCAVNVDGSRVGVVTDSYVNGLLNKVDNLLYDRSHLLVRVSDDGTARTNVVADEQEIEQEIEEEIE